MSKKTIRLADHYHRFGGVKIAPGEYAIDDEALAGQGQYLLDTGHAVEVGAPKGGKARVDTSIYDELSASELKKLAAKNAVDLGEATKRDDIIDKLAAANVKPEAPAPKFDPAEYEHATVPELTEYAKANNVDLGEATKKGDIIVAIIGAGVQPPPKKG